MRFAQMSLAEIIGGHEGDPADTPAGLVWDTQQPLVVSDLSNERRWPKMIGLMREDGVQSCCVVPLTSATQRLGAFEFSSLEPQAYGIADMELMQQIGRQVVVENLVERAVILTQGTQLHVPLQELKLAEPERPAASPTLHDAEREQILRVLRETKWTIGGPHGAAARLGLKRTTLTSKLKRLGLARPRG